MMTPGLHEYSTDYYYFVRSRSNLQRLGKSSPRFLPRDVFLSPEF